MAEGRRECKGQMIKMGGCEGARGESKKRGGYIKCVVKKRLGREGGL